MAVVFLIGLGLIFGSFCNAAIWRLHEYQFPSKKKGKQSAKVEDLSIISGRSACFHCGHELGVWDLIPVLSYLWLRGRCRYCGRPIDDTPLAELLVPLLFVVSYIWWPYNLGIFGATMAWVLFIGWLLCSVGFVILAIYDLRWYLLPDRVVFPLIGLAAVMVLVQAFVFGGGWLSLLSAGWGVLLTAGLFYLLHIVSRGRWIGFGDVKLSVALGLLVGGPMNALLLIFIASLAGSLVAIPLVARGKAVSKTRVPFGPFLLFATVIVVLFGSFITTWYANLLLI